MNIFAFRPFKGKFNLGDSADIPENEDGTLIGAVKEVKASLTANSKSFTASYQGGKYGFMVGNEFFQIGGGTMPALNFASPLHTFTSSALTYTATKDCYLYGNVAGVLASGVVTIDGTTVARGNYDTGGNFGTCLFVPTTKIKAGQVVTITNADILGSNKANLYVLEELS